MGPFARGSRFPETLRGKTALNTRNFFSELKRRNVYKAAVAYAVVAWLLIQIATQTFPFLQIPDWALRLVIMLLVLGFPIALILAWAFEMTPEGLQRTCESDVTPALSTRAQAATAHPARSPHAIALLPLENVAGQPSEEYFADGMTEALITDLAKIRGLRVISRGQ